MTDLSICIPFYGKPAEMLQAAVGSVWKQLPPRSELLLFPDGPDARAVASRLKLPREVMVFDAAERLGLVRNWNRCITMSTGSLIHILHDDDIVAPGFYDTILNLARRYPEAALYATANGTLGEEIRTDGHNSPLLFVGGDAARFLLLERRYACGSVVLTRRAVERQGLFREKFEYCPDEEAYLRYAAAGGLAFAPVPLYRVRTHDAQSRYATWRKPDFVRMYVESRIEGARNFGEPIVRIAGESAMRNVITVGLTLALRGEREAGARRLEELAMGYPESKSSLRFRLAKLACHSPLALRAVALRRRFVRTLEKIVSETS